MREQIEQIRREALEALSKTNLPKDLEELRVRYLGKKGALILTPAAHVILERIDEPAAAVRFGPADHSAGAHVV